MTARARRIISRVPIDQDVDVGIHIGEHPPHHVALALVHLAADEGAGGPGGLDGAIGGIVVVDVDRGLGQRGAEIGHHLANGRRFIEAGHQDRYPMPGMAAAMPAPTQ